MNEMMEQPRPSGEVPVLEPKAIKVFGILHVIFGSLGVIGALFGWLFVLFWRPIFDALSKAIADQEGGDPEVEAMFDGFKIFFVDIQGYLIVSNLLSTILTVMLLMAGLRLLKRRKSSLKIANWWAWASIGGVLFGVVAQFMWMGPAQDRMEQRMEEALQVPTSSANQTAEMVGEIFGTAFGAFIGIAYAALALGFLNRQKVKDFLKTQGT